MANFCTRLVTRTLGLTPSIQPLIASMFIPGDAIAIDSTTELPAIADPSQANLVSPDAETLSTVTSLADAPRSLLLPSRPEILPSVTPPQLEEPTPIVGISPQVEQQATAPSLPLIPSQTNSPAEIFIQKSEATPTPVTPAPISTHSLQINNTATPTEDEFPRSQVEANPVDVGNSASQNLIQANSSQQTKLTETASTLSPQPRVPESIQPLNDEITPIPSQTRLAENQLTTTQDMVADVSPTRNILDPDERNILPIHTNKEVNIRNSEIPEIHTPDKFVSSENSHKLREITKASTDFPLPSSDSNVKQPNLSKVVFVTQYLASTTPSQIEPLVTVEATQPLNENKFTVTEKSMSGGQNTLQPTPVFPTVQKLAVPNRQPPMLTVANRDREGKSPVVGETVASVSTTAAKIPELMSEYQEQPRITVITPLINQQQPLLAERRQTVSSSPASTPTINITIGRIEVRGVNPPTSPTPRTKPVSRSPALSLDNYLQQRNGSQR